MKFKITVTWAMLTPEKAKEAFESRAPNRKFSEFTANPYLREMLAGTWGLSMLMFDEAGQLIDGQHRAWACWQSGVPQWFVIARGLPRAWQMNVDMHRRRRFYEQINLSGELDYELDRRLEATLRIMDRSWSTKGREPPTVNEVLEYGKAHKECIRFIGDAFPSYVKGVSIAPVLAAIGRAYYAVPAARARVQQFCRVLASGVAEDGMDDSAATQLRERLLAVSLAKGGGAARPQEIYRLAEKALQLFLARQRPKLLKASSGDIYAPPSPRMISRPAEDREVA